MALDQYLESMKEIELTKLHSIDMLMNAYVSEHNTVKIGDIAQDHMGKVLIEKIEGIHINQSTREPSLIFSGKELRLDGKPKKNGAKRVIYQGNFKLAKV